MLILSVPQAVSPLCRDPGAYRETEKQSRGEVVMPKVHTAKPTQEAR